MSTAHQWNPEDYVRHSAGQERWAKELLGLLRLQGHEAVLDVGCGDGRITAEIAHMVPNGRVLGVDLSREMIEFAQKTFASGGYPNLRYQQADAAALPFVSEFDVVYSSAALHWVKEHRPVVQGIARALKPQGRCVLQMGGRGNGADVIRAFEECLAQPEWRCEPIRMPYGFWAPEDYREWLAEVGLHPDSLVLIEKDMVHADRNAFTGWLRSAWMPYVSAVPEKAREEYLAGVSRCYVRNVPCDEEGRVHVRMIRLQVEAHKP